MKGKKNNKPFVFKQFEVHHHLCAHKIGFDGVLLGAWVNLEHCKSILDIGTGSGLIALMAAQKNNTAVITGIEIDEDSSTQAAINFQNSLQADRLFLIKDDFAIHAFTQQFDHIITNPPYFLNSLHTPAQNRTTARHTTNYTFTQFIHKAAQLLNPGGKLSFIFPFEQCSSILSIVNHQELYIARICQVYTKNNLSAERVLLECTFEKCNTQSHELFIYETPGKYSAEYIKLTEDFYIHF